MSQQGQRAEESNRATKGARASKRHEALPLFARKPRISSSFLAANLWSCEEGRLRPACGCSGQACGSRNRINGNVKPSRGP